ncbi:Uncharacterised protein g10201 [Pycnogonum litorale]
MQPSPDVYNCNNELQFTFARKFMTECVPKLNLPNLECTIMDVGCGTGNVTKDVVLTSIEQRYQVKNLIAVDRNPAMINFAKETNKSERIEYFHADISSRYQFLSKWKESVDLIVGVNLFNWITETKTVLDNFKWLLKPNGKVLLFYVLDSPVITANETVTSLKKYRKFIKEVGGVFITRKYDDDKRLFENSGFKLHIFKNEESIYEIENEQTLKHMLDMVNPYKKYLPFDLWDEYMEDQVETFKRLVTENEKDSWHQYRFTHCSVLASVL